MLFGLIFVLFIIISIGILVVFYPNVFNFPNYSSDSQIQGGASTYYGWNNNYDSSPEPAYIPDCTKNCESCPTCPNCDKCHKPWKPPRKSYCREIMEYCPIELHPSFNDYIRKDKIPAYPDMTNYIKKSDIPPCAYDQTGSCTGELDIFWERPFGSCTKVDRSYTEEPVITSAINGIAI